MPRRARQRDPLRYTPPAEVTDRSAGPPSSPTRRTNLDGDALGRVTRFEYDRMPPAKSLPNVGLKLLRRPMQIDERPVRPGGRPSSRDKLGLLTKVTTRGQGRLRYASWQRTRRLTPTYTPPLGRQGGRRVSGRSRWVFPRSSPTTPGMSEPDGLHRKTTLPYDAWAVSVEDPYASLARAVPHLHAAASGDVPPPPAPPSLNPRRPLK